MNNRKVIMKLVTKLQKLVKNVLKLDRVQTGDLSITS